MLRKTAIILTAVLVLLTAAAGAAVPRGVVLGDNAGNYAVLRDGEQIPCQKGEFLYDGDIIQGENVSSLEVEWHPYAKPKLISSNEMKVQYEAPGTMDVAVYKVKEFLGLVDKEVTVQYGATRGVIEKAVAAKEKLYPLPGFMATVLTDEPILFVWGDNKGKRLVIKNDKNQEVRGIRVTGETRAVFTAAVLGLSAGERYSWQVEGLQGEYSLMVLHEKEAAKIRQDLMSLEAGSASENEKLLNKAVYLQLISDANPGRIELYWLSYNLLLQIQPGEDGLMKARVERLKANVTDHISSMR